MINEKESQPLTEDAVKSGLSVLGKHPVLLKHCFLELKVEDKEVCDISLLAQYPQLLYLHLSKNKISNLDVLSSLPSLVQLDVSHNQITDCLGFKIDRCTSANSWAQGDESFGSMLTLANLSHNSLTKLTSLDHHSYLEILLLSNNKISEIEGLSNLQFLKVLDLSYNNLTEIKGLDNLQIQELNLEGNQIVELSNLEKLPKLSSLNVKGNSIKSLSHLQMCDQLLVLDVGDNQLEHIRQTELLSKLPLLTSLTMKGNPCYTKRLYRRRVIFRLQKLLKLDSSDVSAEEIIEARNMYVDGPANISFNDDEHGITI